MRRKQASKKPRPLKDQEDKASLLVCSAIIPSSHRTQKAYKNQQETQKSSWFFKGH